MPYIIPHTPANLRRLLAEPDLFPDSQARSLFCYDYLPQMYGRWRQGDSTQPLDPTVVADGTPVNPAIFRALAELSPTVYVQVARRNPFFYGGAAPPEQFYGRVTSCAIG